MKKIPLIIFLVIITNLFLRCKGFGGKVAKKPSCFRDVNQAVQNPVGAALAPPAIDMLPHHRREKFIALSVIAPQAPKTLTPGVVTLRALGLKGLYEAKWRKQINERSRIYC